MHSVGTAKHSKLNWRGFLDSFQLYTLPPSLPPYLITKTSCSGMQLLSGEERWQCGIPLVAGPRITENIYLPLLPPDDLTSLTLLRCQITRRARILKQRIKMRLN